jgi:hypothetical protein
MDRHAFVFAPLDSQAVGVIFVCGDWVTARCRRRSFRGVGRLAMTKIRREMRRSGGTDSQAKQSSPAKVKAWYHYAAFCVAAILWKVELATS